jgi:carbon-monoxide dehydrogenase medium subunit
LRDLDYQAPTSLRDAIALLAEGDGQARPLAGGTDLIVQLREHRKDARRVVDLKRIPELNEVSFDAAGGLTLGAAVPCCRLYEDARLARAFPAIVDAASLIGGIQIQSRATLGGNLCNASPAADGVPPLIVHGAVCRIAGPKGERQVPVESFCTGPGKTVLAPGEVLIAFKIAAPAPRSASRYERFIPRNEMDIAVAGAASWLELDADGSTIRGARIALAAVAPTPLLAEEAGRSLIGKRAGADAFEAAAALARQAARPIDDMRGTAWHRRHLVGILTRRTLEAAFERARSAGRS